MRAVPGFLRAALSVIAILTIALSVVFSIFVRARVADSYRLTLESIFLVLFFLEMFSYLLYLTAINIRFTTAFSLLGKRGLVDHYNRRFFTLRVAAVIVLILLITHFVMLVCSAFETFTWTFLKLK
jgi:hypothetical protein